MNNPAIHIEAFTIDTLAKGALAQLRHLAEKCEDRETARSIYAELGNLKWKLAEKHKFPAEKEKMSLEKTATVVNL